MHAGLDILPRILVKCIIINGAQKFVKVKPERFLHNHKCINTAVVFLKHISKKPSSVLTLQNDDSTVVPKHWFKDGLIFFSY